MVQIILESEKDPERVYSAPAPGDFPGVYGI